MSIDDLSDRLKNSDLRIVVTGGGGWLGRVSLHLLSRAFGDDFQKRVFVFGRQARNIPMRDGGFAKCRDFGALSDLPLGRYIFLHYAFLTKDRVSEMTTDAFVHANIRIAEAVEAAVRRVAIAGFFVPSSGAVYRADKTLEFDLAANPYGLMKLKDEQRFAALADELGCRAVIARVFNLAGPFINKLDSYALSSIIADVLQNKPIKLAATHPVIRSYVHVQDLVMLALAALLDFEAANEPPFDTAGEVDVEIGDLAARTAALLGMPDCPVLRPPMSSEPVNRYVGDRARMCNLAHQYGVMLRGLDEQILDTAEYLRETI